MSQFTWAKLATDVSRIPQLSPLFTCSNLSVTRCCGRQIKREPPAQLYRLRLITASKCRLRGSATTVQLIYYLVAKTESQLHFLCELTSIKKQSSQSSTHALLSIYTHCGSTMSRYRWDTRAACAGSTTLLVIIQIAVKKKSSFLKIWMFTLCSLTLSINASNEPHNRCCTARRQHEKQIVIHRHNPEWRDGLW